MQSGKACLAEAYPRSGSLSREERAGDLVNKVREQGNRMRLAPIGSLKGKYVVDSGWNRICYVLDMFLNCFSTLGPEKSPGPAKIASLIRT